MITSRSHRSISSNAVALEMAPWSQPKFRAIHHLIKRRISENTGASSPGTENLSQKLIIPNFKKAKVDN